MIKITKKNFKIDKEIDFVRSKHSNIGAVSTFIGYVRNLNNKKKVKSIELEVYEKMAIKTLDKICNKAKNKWELIDTLIIHRYGKIYVDEKIVLVATFSKHRKDSFQACKFIMDYLKKDAPFWKKENYKNSSSWLKNSKLKN
tara:strand:- start:794 stop:1219 length:426 start_codon:yes stop_codon:yes gene_type:complete